jgi:hypothetical protein
VFWPKYRVFVEQELPFILLYSGLTAEIDSLHEGAGTASLTDGFLLLWS